MNSFNILIGIIVILSSCNAQDSEEFYAKSELDSLLSDSSLFVDTINGKQTNLYTISNGNGLIASITNYGGRIVGLIVPDNSGKATDVVLGMESPDAYFNSKEAYFGALIGRVGNRIANGEFVLDSTRYTLTTNNGVNTLHGGIKGYQSVVWEADQTSDSTLVLNYISADGEQGFPGELTIKVIYTATERQGLKIEYEASANKTTVVNLTNHAFFNLNGEGSGTINQHLLTINADAYTPVNSTLIPTGEIETVQNTVFDFRKQRTIKEKLNEDDIQLKYGRGYDHNFVLNKKDTSQFTHAAKIMGDKTGIIMDVYTTEPGIQFYGGNFMQGKNTLKNGTQDKYRTAFCLETQHFPDTPNQPSFPPIRLNIGEVYKTTSEYVFSVNN